MLRVKMRTMGGDLGWTKEVGVCVCIHRMGAAG